jgi:hypothetical protein
MSNAIKRNKLEPIIMLEAFNSINLLLWYASFSHPGTLNYISFQVSAESFLDGTFSGDVNFELKITGQIIWQVWLMVDGVYPNQACFIKSISGHLEKFPNAMPSSSISFTIFLLIKLPSSNLKSLSSSK